MNHKFNNHLAYQGYVAKIIMLSMDWLIRYLATPL